MVTHTHIHTHTHTHIHTHTHTHTHTYTHDNYYNPRCAHAHRGLIMNCQSNSTSLKQMKSTKVQTLCAIWLKYWNIWIDNTFACYVLGQWFLTLLEVLNPTSSIHAFIEPSMRRPTKAQTEKRHKETAAANVTNMCLRPLNGGARVTIISLRPRQS